MEHRDSDVPYFRETSAAPAVQISEKFKPFFGFCGLPTLLNRRLLEVSLCDEADRAKLAETCAALGTDYRVVADRVGLVTPRVICQIINEACFTVQEGTATMQDIDLGMRLGTNYPHGPFAWANAIGVDRVYAVLEALWQDTHDERYKVCPLLKRQALRGKPFAV
ncbi:3-hydroxyacyl-CoA dehydrogenase family protein [Hymenobacter sp. UYCo722]|uniref:3-hydroxyacyl-CoA dehydrogenase family protein n=1 Tax=Hymenobacter sp. UYCo722 TaxID=3156335 RepID=UPI003393C618